MLLFMGVSYSAPLAKPEPQSLMTLLLGIAEAIMDYPAHQRAQEGDHGAQSYLAYKYYFSPIHRNYAESFRWFAQLARSGIDLNNVGFMLKAGFGCPKDPQAAVQFFEKALATHKRGGITCYSLATMYARGSGTPKSLEKAYSVFRRALVEESGDYYFFVLAKGALDGTPAEVIQSQLRNKCSKTITENDFREAFHTFLRLCTKQPVDIENIMLQYMVSGKYFGLGYKQCRPIYDEVATQEDLQEIKKKVSAIRSILEGKVTYEDVLDHNSVWDRDHP